VVSSGEAGRGGNSITVLSPLCRRSRGWAIGLSCELKSCNVSWKRVRKGGYAESQINVSLLDQRKIGVTGIPS